MFFAGSLQEGIALAVKDSKTVICFVPDNGETSSTWQDEYFTGDEQFTRLLKARSVLLRIAKDSPEAGFLASVCPITQYPTVVVIRNGMLREYIMPNVSKNEFRARLTAAIDDDTSESQAAAPSIAQRPPQLPQETNSPAPTPDPVVITPARSAPASDAPSKPEQASRDTPENKSSEKGKKPVYVGGSQSQPRKQEEHKDRQSPMDSRERSQEKDTKGNSPIRAAKKEKLAHEPPARRPTQPTGPPTQYRLQVRLFDGSSVRSTFSPTQTIHKDVRPWLDGQLEEKKPYNLKHILTPLPNKTLTITEEDQTLRELITGSTATFVMVPIKTYIDAYSESGSLPVRALSSAYGLVTSVISGTVGYVGSFVGYAQNTVGPSQPEPARPSELQPPTDSARRPRPWGPNIRTLRDQGSEQDSQFYNGNQLNFEPRQNDEP